VAEADGDDAPKPTEGFRVFRKLPKPIGEMTDEELMEFASEMADAMFRAREEKMKQDRRA
jgi:hypothetical protein